MRPASGDTITGSDACSRMYRGEMVDRSLEEPLDLARVEVDRDHPLGPGRLEHVGDEAGRDRLATLGLAVLAGVAVERAHRGDPLGRCPVGRIDHDQVLHDRVVHRVIVDAVVALDHEDVRTADRLSEPAAHFAVGELDQVVVTQLDVEMCRHLQCEFGMGASRVQGQSLGGDLLHEQ
jgi:hypothetical protein